MNKSAPTAKEVFDHAHEIGSPAERSSYLDQVCAGDNALREKVEALLRAFDEAGSFLQKPAFGLSATGPYRSGNDAPGESSSVIPETDVGESRPDNLPFGEGSGRRIGPYRLVEKLGEGGMGTVYLAEQEHPIRRQVALKIIKPGMDSASVVARFEAERQALTMMDHANIARVYEAGTTETGLPYFVMELVKGIPMTRFCDENKLTPRERMQLFESVCEAIQHAHQKGVIHRDVKPSNVLVAMQDGKATAKVIDFGLAKATEQSITDHAELTQFGSVVGTLEYMSPEQADGGVAGVDTRTDIYSLGVMLYELLTGTTPLDRGRKSDAGLTEVLRRIKEEEAPKPSVRVSGLGERLPRISEHRKTEPARLVKLLRGELDWIALKALEKDRARRYETASGFAKDVQRHLDDEPVEACPPSARYRLGKFTRRNRALLATVGGLITFLVLLAVGLTVVSLRENRLKLTAVTAKVRAEKSLIMTDDVMDTLLHNVPKLGEMEKTILRKLKQDYKQVLSETGVSQEAGESHLRLANLSWLIGDLAEAEASYRMGIQHYETLARSFPAVAQYRNRVAKINYNLAILLHQLGRPSAAEAAYSRAIDLHGGLAAEFPGEPNYRRCLANEYNNLGALLRDSKELPKAEKAFRQSLALREKLVGDFPEVLGYQITMAASCGNLGNVIRDQNNANAALAWYGKVIELLTPLKPLPKDAKVYLRNAHWDRANALGQLGRHSEAIEDWQRAFLLDDGADMDHLRRFLAAERREEKLKAQRKPGGELLYEAATVHARAKIAAAETGEESLKERYAKRSLELLKQAKSAGWFGDSQRIKQLMDEQAFKSLPSAEFKAFLESLAPGKEAKNVPGKK